MSEVVAAKKKQPGMAQLVFTLFAISAVCAVCLGLVNMITMNPIQLAKEAKVTKAMQSVLPADAYTPVSYAGTDPLVTAIFAAGDAGWVVQVAPSGFGGAIDMMVGVASDKMVSGVSFITMTETPGLGMNAKNESFYGQFAGGAGPFSVTKDGGQINSITGATITSRAVSNGVNAALDAVNTLG